MIRAYRLLYIFTLSFLHSSTLSDLNDKKKIPLKNSEIKWEKVKTNIRESDKTDLQWDLLETNDLNSVNKKYNFEISVPNNNSSPKIRSINY